MNNIEELICPSRIKEIAGGSSPLIGEKERLALTALHWHQEHRIAVQAFQETGRNLLLAQEQISDLIAQLEAAQKSNAFLKEQMAQLANFNPDWDRLEACQESWRELAELQKETLHRAQKAETELSAANQKLAQPVVLSSSTVMSRACAVRAIKAAGFTVEGNADAE